MELDVGIPCSVISVNENFKCDDDLQTNYEPTAVSKRLKGRINEPLVGHHGTVQSQTTSNSEFNIDLVGSIGTNHSKPRKRRANRPFSPDVDQKHSFVKTKKPSKKAKISFNTSNDDDKNISDNVLNNNAVEPRRCDKCHSPYAIDPAKRKNPIGKNQQKPKFRKHLDVASNKILTLCNKCGLAMARAKKRPPKKAPPTEEEKNKYYEEAEVFALALAERLNEPDAKRLYCPNFKSYPCRCLQKYINGEGDKDSSNADERAMNLIQLLKTAKDLHSEKIHNVDPNTVNGKVSQQEGAILCRGIGNCHSKSFEDFVLSNRQCLREELHFCERASQRVLMYSNNFLHKELKSMKKQRLERKTGKYTKGLLKPIPELPLSTCCSDKCVQLATTHQKQLESWRLNAQGGQQEARKVLAEMLSARGESKSNCYKFISLVTGCSFSTICSVNNYVKKTSGLGDLPEHGLKRWWRENPKKRRTKETDKKFLTDKEFVEDSPDIEAAAVDSDLAPVDSDLTPVESDLAPLGPDLPPVDSDTAPVGPDLSPAESDLALVDSVLAPVDSNLVPVYSDLAPVYSVLAPVESSLAPVETNLAPVDSDLSPVDADLAPVDSDIAHVDSDVAPVDSDLVPVYSDLAPVYSVLAPVKSDLPHVNSGLAPIVSDPAPVDSNLPPVDSDLAPVDSDLVPGCSLPLPPHETKEAAVQVELHEGQLSGLQSEVDKQELQLNEAQEIEEREVQQTPQKIFATASSSHSAVNQLLLLPEMGHVTAPAAPNSLLESHQVSTMNDINEGHTTVLQPVTDTAHRMNSENICQRIQSSQPTSSNCSVIEQNYQQDRLLVDTNGLHHVHQPVGHTLSSCNLVASNPIVELTQPRRLVRVFEIPCGESLPLIPVLVNGLGGGTYSRNMVLVPENLVLEPPMIGTWVAAPPSMVSRHTL